MISMVMTAKFLDGPLEGKQVELPEEHYLYTTYEEPDPVTYRMKSKHLVKSGAGHSVVGDFYMVKR